jgi:hypothetical protein
MDTQTTQPPNPEQPKTLSADPPKAESTVADLLVNPETVPFSFSGRIGGPFLVRGHGFGDKHPSTFETTPAIVEVNGMFVQCTRWDDGSIKGILPPGLRPGTAKIVIRPVEGPDITIKGRIS